MKNIASVQFLTLFVFCQSFVARSQNSQMGSMRKYSDVIPSNVVQKKYNDALNDNIQTRRRLDSFITPTIKTIYGQISGIKVRLRDSNLADVVQYLGIPYARPPVDKLRWSKPENLKSWGGVLNATKMGPACPQPLNNKLLPDVLLPLWYQRNPNIKEILRENMDEDCLYLNIYVPAKFYLREGKHPNFYRDPLPVMVYIHGHTFSEGSGNLYDGSALASYGDVIVVTINYRLGVLGFLSTLDVNCPGNFGLWDQVKALQWISKNINEFGGDPTQVTLFGSGSGAASINLLMCSVQSDRTFARAILQSGTALAPWVIVRKPKHNSKKFSRLPKINCDRNTAVEMIECLKTKSWRDLVGSNIQTDLYNLAFGPVVDGRNGILLDEPAVLMDRGEYLNYPIMIGISKGDGYGFVQQKLSSAPLIGRTNEVVSFDKESERENFTREMFQLNVVNFIDNFYKNKFRVKRIIENIVEFMYTDWGGKYGPNGLKKSLLDMYTDKQWVEPIVRTAYFHSRYNYQVHLYTLSYRPEDQSIPDWVEAVHGDELPMVFGAPLAGRPDQPIFNYNFTDTDNMISSAVMTYWTNFAKKGDPMKGVKQKNSYMTTVPNYFQGVKWLPFDLISQQHIDISERPKLSDHYRATSVALWKSFLPALMTGTGASCTTSNVPPYSSPSNNNNNLITRLTPISTQRWLPKPGTTKKYGKGPTYYDSTDEGGISLQLSITLAIGFVLLFINIIAFAVVSYHKEKDKYKIEKLQSQLRREKSKHISIDGTNQSTNKRSNGNVKAKMDKVDCLTAAISSASTRETATLPRCAYTMPKHSPPTRTYSVNALPIIRPSMHRHDSLTSPLPYSDDGYNTTGRSLKWKPSNGGNFKCSVNVVDKSGFGSAGVPSTLNRCDKEETYDRSDSDHTRPRQSAFTDNRYKTMPQRGIPSVINVIKPIDNEAQSSFGTLPSTSSHKVSRSSTYQLPPEVKQNCESSAAEHNTCDVIDPTSYLPTSSIESNTSSPSNTKGHLPSNKLPMIISPINEISSRHLTSTEHIHHPKSHSCYNSNPIATQ